MYLYRYKEYDACLTQGGVSGYAQYSVKGGELTVFWTSNRQLIFAFRGTDSSGGLLNEW
jgi:hypothetical protein